MPAIDSMVHQPVRLRVMSCLVSLDHGEQVDFTYLRDLLKLTDGNLGAHLGKLESVGYIEIEKVFVDNKPRTYVAASGQGRDAFANHVAALKEIIGTAAGSDSRGE